MNRIKRLKLVPKIILIILISFIILFITLLITYKTLMGPTSNDEDHFILVEIKPGSSVGVIADTLKENELIKSPFVFKLYIKLNNINKLQAGHYNLSTNMGVKKIVSYIEQGKAINPDSFNIIFPEGKNMRGIATIISNNTNNTYEEVFNLLEEEEYIDSLIDEYWFLTNDIKDPNIYYPLEGYLFPDTYALANKDVSIKSIFKIMLDKMDIVLSKYKDNIESKNFSVHEFLTMASIVESEGINDDDRPKIAEVFYNRLDLKIAFGSCVTACYATKTDSCLYKYVNTTYDSPYNTYLSSLAGKLPIGPISNPGEASIKASINPEEHDYLFFLSDKNKKTYFTKSNSEHVALKKELQDNGLWYEGE